MASTFKHVVEFRSIPGFPDYRVGSDGAVFSRRRRGRWKQMKPTRNSAGYFVVGLYRDGSLSPKQFRTSQLVLMAFRGMPRHGEQGRHLDGNPKNNWLGNLAWGTAKQNADDRGIHGRTPMGSQHWNAKLSEKDVREIRRRVGCGELHSDIAIQFGVDKTLISHIACGRIWTEAGGPTNRKSKCKITACDVREIRKLASAGTSLAELESMFPVRRPQLSMIVSRKRWAHIE